MKIDVDIDGLIEALFDVHGDRAYLVALGRAAYLLEGGDKLGASKFTEAAARLLDKKQISPDKVAEVERTVEMFAFLNEEI
jgi:hypothetical protein